MPSPPCSAASPSIATARTSCSSVAAVLWSLSIGMTSLGQRRRHALRCARAARRLGGAQLPRPDRRRQPLAVAARAGDRARQRAARRAAGAGGRRPDRHPAAGSLDWRLTFGVLFVLSAAWVPLWYFLFRDSPPSRASSTRPSSPTSAPASNAVAAAPHAALKSWPEPGVLKAAADQCDAARQLLGLLRLRLFPVFLHDLAAELSRAQYGLNLRRRRPVHGAALAVGGGAAVAVRALVGSSSEDHRPPARRALLSDRRQPVRRRPRGRSGGADQRPHGRHHRHHAWRWRPRWAPTRPIMR